MKNLKVVAICERSIKFDDEIELSSEHESDCCEVHELCISDLDLSEFEGLRFNLEKDDFFKRIPEYGIELIPISGHPVRIAGHGNNNGYYSDNLALVITKNGENLKSFDISECQDVSDE